MGNRFYGYRQTDLELPGGRTATYHGVLVEPCVHVVAIEDDLRVHLVRQKRPNVRQVGDSENVPETLELPGGFSDGRPPEEAAQSELMQEVHRRAGSLVRIGTVYPSTGISSERDHIFLGRDLEVVERTGIVEATEQDMRIVTRPFGQIYDQMRRGQLPVAAQTLAALSMAEVHL